MAGAALAWGAPSQEQSSRSIHCWENCNRLCCQNHSWTTQLSWPVPAKAHPGGWTEIPCSASLTHKPQSISWQQGDKEKADRDSISDGRKYTQALGSFIRTSFTCTPLEADTFASPLLSPHSCFPLIKDFTSSAPLLWLGRLKTLSGLNHTTAMGTSTVSFSMTSLGLLKNTKTKVFVSGHNNLQITVSLKTFIVGKKLIKHWKLHQQSYSQGLLILSQDSEQEAGMGSEGTCTG